MKQIQYRNHHSQNMDRLRSHELLTTRKTLSQTLVLLPYYILNKISLINSAGTLYNSDCLNLLPVNLLSAVLPARCASSLCLVFVSFIAKQSF